MSQQRRTKIIFILLCLLGLGIIFLVHGLAHAQATDIDKWLCNLGKGRWVGDTCLYNDQYSIIMDMSKDFPSYERTGWPDNIYLVNAPTTPHHFYVALYQPDTGRVYILYWNVKNFTIDNVENVGVKPLGEKLIASPNGYWFLEDFERTLNKAKLGGGDIWGILQVLGGLESYQIIFGCGEAGGDIVGAMIMVHPE